MPTLCPRCGTKMPEDGRCPACATSPGDPARTTPYQAAPEPATPAVAGYEVLGELGAGGMGIVYRARHPGLGRVVALKMIRAGAGAGELERERFRAEARAAARLQHPNVVQIFEVGEQGGQPFCALEYLDGGSLRQKLAGEPQSPRDAASLVETLARAVHAAHQAGVVHRDLKPANVLLAADGTPKISDFGLARLLDDDSGRTQSGQVLGTPSYMAPEQAAGRNREVGPAADVWALGAILYECLTGRPPFRGAGVRETLEQVRTLDPVPVRRLQPRCPRDLETVCLKCLHKEPQRRYATAQDLAEDLRRFQADEPIRARPVGRIERGVRWCRRHPARASALLLLLVLAVGGPWVAVEQVRLRQKVDESLRGEKEALKEKRWKYYQIAVGKAQDYLQQAQLPRANALLLDQVPRPGEDDLRGFEWYHLWKRLHPERRKLSWDGTPYFRPDGKTLTLVKGHYFGTVEVRDFDSGELRASLTLGGQTAFRPPTAVSADRTRLASGGLPGTVHVWDLHTGRLLDQLSEEAPSPGRSPPAWLAFTPDGRRLVGVRSDDNDRALLLVWDLESRKVGRFPLAQAGRVEAVALAPDGRRLAVSSVKWDPNRPPAGELKVWEVAGGREVLAQPQRAEGLAFSPDGRLLALVRTRLLDWEVPGAVKRWDTQTNTEWPVPLKQRHAEGARVVAFAPDGRSLAASAPNGTTTLWNAATGEVLETYPNQPAFSLTFSPDGRSLLQTSTETCVWDAVPGRSPPLEASQKVECVAVSPDGRTVATGGASLEPPGGGVVKLWDLATGEETMALHGFRHPVYAVVFSPDGRTLAAGGGDVDRTGEPGETRLFDAATGRERLALSGLPGVVLNLAFAPDGKTLATTGRSAKVWDAQTGRERATLEVTTWVNTLAFSPDGKLLATGGGWWGENHRGELRLWDVAEAKTLAVLEGHKEIVHCLAFAPDGRTLATAGADDTFRLWDVAGRREQFSGTLAKGQFTGLVYAPDGKSVLTVGLDGQVVRWKPREDREGWVGHFLNQFNRLGHRSRLLSLAVTPDGTTLVAGNGWVQLFDLAQGHWQPLRGPGVGSMVTAVAWAPDGQSYAVGEFHGAVRIRKAGTGEMTALLWGRSRQPVSALAFAPDGRTLAAGGDGVGLWDVSTRRLRGVLPRDRLPMGSSLAFSPDGKLLATGGLEAKSVRLWDAQTLEDRGGLDGSAPVAFLPDGRALVVGVWAGPGRLEELRVVEVPGGEVRSTLPMIDVLGLSPDGRLVAGIAPGRRAGIWEIDTGRQRADFPQGLGVRPGILRSFFALASFSPDGREVAVVDNGVRLWDTSTGEERFLFEGTEPLQCVAFSPDGRWLLAAGGKAALPYPFGTADVRLWQAATSDDAARDVHREEALAAEKDRREKERQEMYDKDPPSRQPLPISDNSNTLLRRHRAGLSFAASSEETQAVWGRASAAADGHLEYAWSPARKAAGAVPWWEVAFPEDVTVRRVTVLGHRVTGSGVGAGAIELYNAAGNRLHAEDAAPAGDYRDFDFRLPAPVAGVRRVRFVVREVDARAPFGVAVGEVLIE